MKELRRFYGMWKRRNWFTIQVNPDLMENGEWYTVHSYIKKQDKEQLYDNFVLFRRRLKKKEVKLL